MDNLDDDMDFNSVEVRKIASSALELIFNGDMKIEYQKDKVNQWCQQITESIIKELSKLGKPFKYAVTCIIIENNGSGLQTATGTCWDLKKDGVCAVQISGEKFSLIVTVFGMAI